MNMENKAKHETPFIENKSRKLVDPCQTEVPGTAIRYLHMLIKDK